LAKVKTKNKGWQQEKQDQNQQQPTDERKSNEKPAKVNERQKK